MREHPRPWPNPWKGIDNGNGSGLRSVWWVRIDAAQQGRRSRSPATLVPAAKRHPDPKSASIDHIIPISRGGGDVKANVQLTHFSCNIAKNNRALPQGEQLRLIG